MKCEMYNFVLENIFPVLAIWSSLSQVIFLGIVFKKEPICCFKNPVCLLLGKQTSILIFLDK